MSQKSQPGHVSDGGGWGWLSGWREVLPQPSSSWWQSRRKQAKRRSVPMDFLLFSLCCVCETEFVSHFPLPTYVPTSVIIPRCFYNATFMRRKRSAPKAPGMGRRLPLDPWRSSWSGMTFVVSDFCRERGESQRHRTTSRGRRRNQALWACFW